ncbi:V-type ATPase [Colletotrichum scovillei]|uniref:V-type ATPase n=1 Tax=Colletotrichum scovillei TaxID=1209932 RepID=UPI0015C35F28|nr:V-type ATPase [Colletotrichum scovillei]KAF4783212.1 V-type ATPase [Colletotrichum scovillei]
MDEIVFANLDRCPSYSSFFGAMGCISAIVFTVLGSSYGTAKSSAAIFAAGVLRPDRLMQNTLCAIMAQILSIYGLVAAVIIANRLVEKQALHTSFLQFAAGISVGLCGLAAGFAIGIVGDAGGELVSSPIPLLPLAPSVSPTPCIVYSALSMIPTAFGPGTKRHKKRPQ